MRHRLNAVDAEDTQCFAEAVERGGCEIILCQDASRVFVELSRNGVDQLLKEVAERAIPAAQSWRGYDVLRIADPDGNDLLVCLENLL